MPITKNALIRYQALDRCFSNPGRMYFWDDLLAACNSALAELNPDSNGIQRRQLFDDIRFMESDQGWSVPLERKRFGRKVYYRYEDTSFSINNQPINEAESQQIKSALQILSRFTGTPQFEWVNEMIPMLESKFGFKRMDQEVISFDSNFDLKGKEFIGPLFDAIVNKRVLLVKYQDFKTEFSYDINFHPYFLKQYNNRWFAFGMNEYNQKEDWNMALDRIVSLEETDQKYIPSNIDWDDYFFDIVGVTKSNGVDIETIVLKFSKEIAPYILTKPIHPSQKDSLDENGLNVRIKVIPNYELESLLLSYGENVEIISPEYFKERINQRIQSMYYKYN